MFDYPASPPVGTTVTVPDGTLRLWDGVKWNPAVGPGQNVLQAFVGDAPPTSPFHGELWFDSKSPQLYIWYSDPNSSQWVVVTGDVGGLNSDAPSDGNAYGRRNGIWTDVSASPYIATGSTTPRTAQDRAADVANVLDFGADPTRTTDSTAAFQAAANTGKMVYVPTGLYLISGPITLTGPGIRGESKMGSMLQISGSFAPMSAQGVIIVNYPGGRTLIEKLWIRFSQPDTAVRANIIQYPPGICQAVTAGGNYLRIVRCYITQAWTGVYLDNGGGTLIDDLECSAYSRGLWISPVNPALDVIQISKFHAGNFDQTVNQCQVMWDGTTIAADIGRVDGLFMSDSICFREIIQINNTSGTPGWYEFSNLMMDSTTSQFIVNDCYRVLVGNCYWSKGTPSGPAAPESPGITINGGRHCSFVNCSVDSSNATQPGVLVTGGTATFIGGATWWQENAATSMFSVTGGTLNLARLNFGSHIATLTAPIIHQSGTGVLCTDNLSFAAGITGIAIQADTLTTGSQIGAGVYNSFTLTLPANMPYVPLVAGGNTLNVGSAAQAATTQVTLNSTGYRSVNYYENSVTRWQLATLATTSNSDFVLARYNSSGVQQNPPLTVRASNGNIFTNQNSFIASYGIAPENLPAPYSWRGIGLVGAEGTTPAIEIFQNSNANAMPMLRFGRSRGTATAPLALQNNDILGDIIFGGYDGTAWQSRTGIIRIAAAAGWANGSAYDTTLQFYGSTGTALTQYMTLSSQGIGASKVTATATAPGANTARLAFIAGTNAGTGKLVAYCGTSTTPVTIVDNIGAGF